MQNEYQLEIDISLVELWYESGNNANDMPVHLGSRIDQQFCKILQFCNNSINCHKVNLMSN